MTCSDSSPRVPGLWPGLILVTIGGGLLARELGYLPAGFGVVDFWPLAVVLFGIAQLVRARGAVGVFFGLAFTAAGGVLFAGNLGLGDFTAARYWPALLILLGLSVLFAGGSRRRQGEAAAPRIVHSDDEIGEDHLLVSEDSRLDRNVSLSGAQFRIESQAWTGGDLSVTAAGVEIDLRHARLAEGGATLRVHVVMGGVDIRVPDTWHVVCDISPFLGGADDVTRGAQGDPSAPRLRIVGNVTLGGVSVRN